MKSTVKNSYVIILFIPFLFSCHRKSGLDNLERALVLAGENRIELEKVLEHYSNDPADNLKLKAAKFLIENMDRYFFYASPKLDAYYNTLDSIFSLNERYENLTNEQKTLLDRLRQREVSYFKSIPDLQYVTTGLLIDNIDRAFEAWEQPFARDMNFDDFCEYLLPYKSGTIERPDFWRSIYRDTFYPYVKAGLDISCQPDSGLILHYPFIELDGTNYLSITEKFDTIPEFTVSCLVKPTEYRTWKRTFDFGKDLGCYVCFVPYNDEGIAMFQLLTPPNVWEDIKENAPLPLDRFTHVAISYSNSFISFYINGILKRRIRTFLTNNDLTRNYIGVSGKPKEPSSGYYFKGEIENFRIYNRELNYAEIHCLAGKTDLPEQRELTRTIVQRTGRLCNINIVYRGLPGGYRSVQLINLKQGSCDDYAVWGTSVFRSLGIPSAIDFVPQWANRSMGHSWNAVYTGNGRMEDYSFGAIALLDSIGNHLKDNEERETNKASKIFRKTYGRQPETPAVQQKDKYLPPVFQDPCIKDVTGNYLDCADITVSLTQYLPKRRYAYLCNFNNHDWIPVHWGEIKAGKAVFTKMGKDVAYLPVYYDWKGIQPAAEPFILTKEGEIKKLMPDHSKKQTLILTRKYRPGNVPKKGELLVGGRFQIANKADFSDSITVYTVNNVPEIRYNSFNLTLNKPYRYFRFLSTPDSRGGEISEIEIYSTESKQKLSGKIIGNKNCPEGWEAENVFDDNPLTSYKCEWGETGWVGLDFGKPVNITSFRYLPRNDDNFIKEGEEYELFYWDNHQWNSLGKQIGTSKQYLEYSNAPLNALFWLRNLTKGKEERIFTYENEMQIWW